MSDGDRWDALVSDLYLSAVDPGAAARLPSRLATLTGGNTASMWRLDRRTIAPVGQFLTNVPAEGMASYYGHYYRQDPWADLVHTARFGRVLRGAEVVDDASLTRSAFYNEFGVEHGLFHVLGLIVPLGPDAKDKVGAVSILRPRNSEAFDSRAAAALESVLSHLRNTFQLHEQLDGRMDALCQEALDGALEALHAPAAALAGDGTVVRCNALIEPMLLDALPRGRTVLALTRNPDAGRRLTQLVASAAMGRAGGQIWLPHPTRPALATVAPLPEALARLDASKRARALLLLRPATQDRSGQMSALIRSVFGLTEAEAQVAARLVAGQSPNEIADAREVRISTVRTLLARVQDKVGARNLRDLVRLLALLG